MDSVDHAYDRVLVLQRLMAAFGGVTEDPDTTHYLRGRLASAANATTIGVEVEVRFSSYFPQLFDEYRLDLKPYSTLTPHQQTDFLRKLAPLEQPLQQKLLKSVECGVPKGKDRYWEFATRPAFHPDLIADELNLLRQAGLIPWTHCHSLHVTIGGLWMGKTAGMLLMILELLGYTSKARIMSGVDPKRAVSWSRKGRAGMRQRITDLEYDSNVAVELRTLELPGTHQDTQWLLYVTWLLAECLRRPDLRDIWDTILAAAISLIPDMDITSNWGPGYENVDKWIKFADTIEHVDSNHLRNVVKRTIKERIIDNPEMLTPQNVYLLPSHTFSTIIY
jgi:hypothetical protein